MAKVHACILGHLAEQYGFFTKKENKKAEQLRNLMAEFKQVQSIHSLPMGDFPQVNKFREIAANFQIHKFPKLDAKLMREMDHVLAHDIPRLMRNIPELDQTAGGGGLDQVNPFSEVNAPVNVAWIIDSGMKADFDNKFLSLAGNKSKLSGAEVAPELMRSGLTRLMLKRIWELSDLDSDGHLDSDEFAVAMYLIKTSQQRGHADPAQLPPTLPDNLVPPSKRASAFNI
jgi:hypothetical protein